MITLLVILGVLALVWIGAWRIAGRRIEKILRGLIGRSKALSAETVQVRDTPQMLRARLTAPRVETPGLRWQGPLVQAQVTKSKPLQLTLRGPARHELQIGKRLVSLETRRLSGRVRVGAARTLPLAHTALTLVTGHAKSDGLDMTLGELRADLTPLAETGRYQVSAVAEDLDFNGPLGARLSAALETPATDGALTLQGQVMLDRALDRRLAKRAPGLLELKIDTLEIALGDQRISVDGVLTRGERERAEGAVTLRLSDWRRAFALAQEFDAVPAQMAPMAQQMLGGLADKETGALTLPLTLAEGKVKVMGLAIAKAPKFPG